jgi:adenylyltransferase/sulfurtransferase
MVVKEMSRYFRQILLPDFGEAAQEKLEKATVLISGAGGLGSPVAIYLAAAGLGKLIICDHDRVELTNLNRQILFDTTQIGSVKTDAAGEKLNRLNPGVSVETHHMDISAGMLGEVAGNTMLMVDCLDNLRTRLELNTYCIGKGIPIVHGGIEAWSGQLTFLDPPRTPCMNCLFGMFSDSRKPKPVLGALAGVIGCMQALEVIRHIAGLGGNLRNRLLHFDGRNMEWTTVEIHRDPECSVCSTFEN